MTGPGGRSVKPVIVAPIGRPRMRKVRITPSATVARGIMSSVGAEIVPVIGMERGSQLRGGRDAGCHRPGPTAG